MNSTHTSETSSESAQPESVVEPQTAPGPLPDIKPDKQQSRKPERTIAVQPVLEKLFELYPHLFGSNFLPLKLGIFQELMASHPDVFKRDELKAALGFHTRSARYLQSVAAGNKRHDLAGVAGDDVAPEHVYLAILELFRRRQARTRDDLSPELRARLLQAFAASGMTRQAYLETMQKHHADNTAQLDRVLAEHAQKQAKHEALFGAFQKSGKSPEEFADMYGLDRGETSYIINSFLRLSGVA